MDNFKDKEFINIVMTTLQNVYFYKYFIINLQDFYIAKKFENGKPTDTSYIYNIKGNKYEYNGKLHFLNYYYYTNFL